MIIVDLRQVLVSNLFVNRGSGADKSVDLFRHMCLNTIRALNVKFRADYGEMVIACDSRSYWRKEKFPFYKANRSKDRDEGPLDWDAIFNTMRSIEEDLRVHFPYRVVYVDGCEADDVIGTLCHEYGSELNIGQGILIVSGDKDFRQLHKFGNVKQYDTINKKWITVDNPADYLKEHIIKGDSGDGIPNVLCPDDYYANKPSKRIIMSAKRLAEIKAAPSLADLPEPVARNMRRNEMLIDLSYVPLRLKDRILEDYESQAGKGRDKLLPYFMEKRLRHLTESLNEF